MTQIIQPVWLDLDWFGLDSENELAHFASAGGHVPKLVAEDTEKAVRTSQLIRSLPEISEAIINPNLKGIVGSLGNQELTRYLLGFLIFTKRGFYSYDRTVSQESDNHNYHLVIRPSKVITLGSLPTELIECICKTRFNVSFKKQSKIDVSSVVLSS